MRVVANALGDLRGLAHGIYPAILTEAGLGPALATLADAGPIAVRVTMEVVARCPPQVESAAYAVVAEALDEAAGRGAVQADVTVGRDGDRLEVRLEDDGSPRTSAMVHVADRFGALGGEVEFGPHMLRAVIPCA